MNRYIRILFSVVVVLFVAFVTVLIVQLSHLYAHNPADGIKQGTSLTSSEFDLHISSASLSSAISSATPSSMPSVSTVSATAPSSKSPSSSSSKSSISKSSTPDNSQDNSDTSNTPVIPVVKNIIAIPPAPPAASSSTSTNSTDFTIQTGIPGVSIYEYGRTLLNSKEQSCYDQLAAAILAVNSSVTIQTDLQPPDVEKIFDYYQSDHAEVFYLNGTGLQYGYKTVSGSTVYVSYTFNFTYEYDKSTIINMRNNMSTAINLMLKNADGKVSDYDKEKALHDAVVLNSKYDMNAVSNPDAYPDSFSAYGLFVNKTAVCEGYAKAMKILLNSVGIKALYVTGTAEGLGNSWESHAWNEVLISGKWYDLDATFDDPVMVNKDGSYSEYGISYAYFNVTAMNDHRLGTYDNVNPWAQVSENYENMPSIG